MAVSKVELYAAIRHDARVEGLSSRALSAKYGVGRRTVAMALESAWPAPRKQLPPRASRLDAFKATIDQILRDDLDAPRKQRHTVKRVFDRLIDEHDARGVTYSMVRAYIFQRRPEIRIEEGRGPPQAFVPQTHRPGDEAEVDFGDVWIHLNGVSTKVFLFSLRLSFSGKAVHKIFASCGQEAFLEGHVHALEVLGGVPRGKVRYDNLRAAVSQVLGRTRGRVESDRWTAFRSHFSIESFYCNPGIEGAHEKGGVEGQIGWFRRNHFVPVPKVASLAELNAMVERWDEEDDARRIMQRALTIGELFAVERPLLVPLPEEDFETGLVSSLRVDRYGQVSVRTNHYSVPVRLIGRRVRVVLHASELVVYDAHREVARHERLIAKGGSRLELDHYLEALVRKPGALPGATALDQARSAGKFTPVHDAWWQAACKAHGDAEGTRALIAVLLLHRHMVHEHVVAGIATALRAGALTADAVALEARKWGEADQGQQLADQDIPRRRRDGGATVTSLTERRLAALPPDPRPLPSVAAYDQLLRFRRRPADGQAYQEEAP
ncbi:IS21 family transposase [Streptomyces sp. NBC_01637]|uniref:IS21 family transposase n=1 Tax=unclassified Streptomyces TaxID=2593676 RepID=UPI0038663F6A|nr:IS21 family transposase [Streptomyces sp. NBC_01653]WTD93978.1 IS21 family transposase [Streptomyces sp. NBC_01637]WTF25147.1 IS21 family transposase [Streptomyces sp. NBC_01602]